VARRNQPPALEEALSVFGISIETALGPATLHRLKKPQCTFAAAVWRLGHVSMKPATCSSSFDRTRSPGVTISNSALLTNSTDGYPHGGVIAAASMGKKYQGYPHSSHCAARIKSACLNNVKCDNWAVQCPKCVSFLTLKAIVRPSRRTSIRLSPRSNFPHRPGTFGARRPRA
jgi:hypothetical protein